MKKFFTLIAVAAMAFAAQAAEVTVADGTETGDYAPVYGYYFDEDIQHNQMQYPATELGMTAGTEITGMKFYTSTIDLVNALNGTVKVSLANIDDVTPWTLDGYGYVSGNLLDVAVTTVAATVAVSADEDGVWTITFDAPFTYTGGALLVDVETVQSGSYKETKFYGKEMGSHLVMSTYGYAGTKKGQTILPKVTFTIEEGSQEEGITTLSQANALEDAAEFTFNGNAVVTVFWNGNLYLRDESGYGQIEGVTGSFENGQVLSQGWNATKTSVDGWVKYTDAANVSASDETNAELAAAQKLNGAVDETMLNAYVYVENVNKGFLPIRTLPLPDGTSINLTGNGNQPATGNYNVYGIIWKVNGALVFEPVKWEKYVAPPTVLRGDVNGNGEVDLDDLTALINYLVYGTAVNMPNSAACNSVDDTTDVNLDDLTALINYLVFNQWAN